MFYDCRHKEATQRKREGKTEKERWRTEQNKDSATEHKASFIMSSCWERRKTKKRKERRRNWSKRGRLDAVDFTFIFTVNCNFHIHFQLPLVLH